MAAPEAALGEFSAHPLRQLRPDVNEISLAEPLTSPDHYLDSAPQPARTSSADASKSREKHSATEKRRRDRIQEGFNALKEVVMPYKEKEDQAAFLKSAAEYIRQLQSVLHHFTAGGLVKDLPEDVQWSIKALLSRATPQASPAPPHPSYPGLPQLLLHLVQNMNKDNAGGSGLDVGQMQMAMQQAALMQQLHMQQCAQMQFSQALHAAHGAPPMQQSCQERQMPAESGPGTTTEA